MTKNITITVANQKGGVGKTTSVMNISAALAEKGHRVLMIDLDPQGNLSSHCGLNFENPALCDLQTTDEIFTSKKPITALDAPLFIYPVSNNLKICATDQHLGAIEYFLISKSDRLRKLKEFIAVIAGQFDYVIIDTPPSMGLLTQNALVASDFVLIPVQPEFFSLEGIVKVKETIEDIRSNENPDLEILGVLPTQVNLRRRLTNEVLGVLKSEMKDLIMEQSIRENSSVSESSGHGVSVMEYQNSSNGSIDYRAAANEIVNRIARTLGASKSENESKNEFKHGGFKNNNSSSAEIQV